MLFLLLLASHSEGKIFPSLLTFLCFSVLKSPCAGEHRGSEGASPALLPACLDNSQPGNNFSSGRQQLPAVISSPIRILHLEGAIWVSKSHLGSGSKPLWQTVLLTSRGSILRATLIFFFFFNGNLMGHVSFLFKKGTCCFDLPE